MGRMYGFDRFQETQNDLTWNFLTTNDSIGLGGRYIRKCAKIGYVLVLTYVMVSATAVSGLAADQAASAEDLTYITEQYPPYNFQNEGRLQGISIDLLEMVWERLGVSLNRSVVELLPWTVGYQRTLNEKNTVLFGTARLPEREQLFKWAGPIGSIRNVLLAKKDKNISITTIEDLKRYKIGAIKDTSPIQMLLNKGMEKDILVLEMTPTPLIEMLQNESIDAWAFGDIAGIWLIQGSGLNSSDYTTAYVLGQTDYYYAFNKDIPDSLVQSFQQALDYIKKNKDKDGVSDYERILSRYSPVTL
jgi:polar amino acid transport system substrate-binding protein